MNKILTPLKSIRKNCLCCCGDSAYEVSLCHITDCALHSFRLGKRPLNYQNEKKLTPIRSIRSKCIECSNYNKAEVRKCDITDCYLYPFRFGKNPNRKGIGGNKNLINLKNQI